MEGRRRVDGTWKNRGRLGHREARLRLRGESWESPDAGPSVWEHTAQSAALCRSFKEFPFLCL